MDDETNGAIDLKDVRRLARGTSTLKKLTSLFGGGGAGSRRSVPRSAAKKARKTRAAKTVEVPGLGKVPASTVKKWAPTIGGLILGRMLTRPSSGGGSRRRRARPEDRDAAFAQPVGQPAAQRRFRPHDHQFDLVGFRKIGDPLVFVHGDRHALRHRGDPGVAGRAPEFLHLRRLRQLPAERVLAPARTDDQNLHLLSLFPILAVAVKNSL